MYWQNRNQGSKYKNKKVTVTDEKGNVLKFDSKKEYSRYQELKLLEAAGEITGLKMQEPFILIPRQQATDINSAERACKYLADFYYIDKAGNTVVEDVKGLRTTEYIIKRKLMKQKYPFIMFREI